MSAAFRDNMNLLQSLCVGRVGYFAPSLRAFDDPQEEYQGLPTFSSFSDFCSALREDPAFDAQCVQCDRKHLRIALNQAAPHCYVCHAGCWESMSVLRGHSSAPLGVLVFGQVRAFDSLPDPERYARHRNARKLRALYRHLPSMSGESVQRWARVFSVVGGFIADSALQEIRQDGWARAVFNYVEANVNRPISLQEIARVSGKSRSFLTHNFSRRFGGSLRRYLNERRVARAKELLADGLSIKEVSSGMGFNDRYVFTKMFKKVAGVSPGKFARKK